MTKCGIAASTRVLLLTSHMMEQTHVSCHPAGKSHSRKCNRWIDIGPLCLLSTIQKVNWAFFSRETNAIFSPQSGENCVFDLLTTLFCSAAHVMT